MALDAISAGNALLRIVGRCQEPDRLSDDEWNERVQECTWFVQQLEYRIANKIAELFK